MCSINGCTNRDPGLVERMNTATRHRGPDDTGVWSDDHVSLGNNRLAILDLSPLGHQPMHSADERFVVAFNGEIYNFRELRSELSDYPFKSESDTEVLLAGFKKWGSDLFAKLNGIFAFAMWDRETKTLYLVRDRMGIKPLYIFRGKDRIVFSSEIKAILESPEIDRRIAPEVLAKYLRMGYTPGTQTLFAGIERLPAGTFMKIAGNDATITSYWHPSYDAPISGNAAREQLRDTVDAAVKRQLVSDRPLGVYLSGGIDSSVVLDAMSRAGGSIDSYSVGFDVAPEEQAKFNADFLIARKTAAHYGARHHEYMLGGDHLQELFESAVYHLDEPVGNATILAQLALSRFAKESVTVVLGGDGGDELFGGYPRYALSRQMDRYQRYVPSPLRAMLSASASLSKLNTPPGAKRYALFHFIKDPVVREIAPQFVNDSLERDAAARLRSYGDMKFGDALMRLDREWWLQDEALLRSDKLTMAAGIEGRVPLLDNEVVALADRIALSEKVGSNGTKLILRDAFRGRLPAYLFDEPKRGWFSPGAKWLRLPAFEAYAREVLSPGYAEATRGLFDWNGIESVLNDHIKGTRYNSHIIWTLLALQVWARAYKIRS